MSRIPPIRTLPRRIISGVSAALTLLVLTTLCGIVPSAAAQYARPRRIAPPPRARYAPPQQSRPQPPRPQQQLARPQPQQQQSHPSQNAPTYAPPPRPSGTPPAENRPATNAQQQLVNPGHPGQMQQHLPAWLDAHRNLTLAQQQQALENEPDFHKLKPDEQQRVRAQLTRLNNMQPEKREKDINRAEAMERLAPAQRQQVREAAGQFASLSLDRQSPVRQAFHNAIELPESQRAAYVNSPAVRGRLSDNELDTLNRLLAIQPAAARAGLKEFIPRSQAPPTPPEFF